MLPVAAPAQPREHQIHHDPTTATASHHPRPGRYHHRVILTPEVPCSNASTTAPAAPARGLIYGPGGELNSAPLHPSQSRRAARARRRALGMMQFLPFTLYLYFLSCTIYISHRRRWSAASQSIIKWLGAKDAYK